MRRGSFVATAVLGGGGRECRGRAAGGTRRSHRPAGESAARRCGQPWRGQRTPAQLHDSSAHLDPLHPAPCRALLQTSGRPPRRRPSSPPLARTASSPLALRCCSLVRVLGGCPVCRRANDAPALLLTGFFGLSTSLPSPRLATPTAHTPADRSLINVPLVGAPASITFGYAPRTCRRSAC